MEYHKIENVFERDMQKDSPNNGKLIMGKYKCPEFGYLANNEWVFTEKVDGTNIRIIWDGTDYAVKGRTEKSQIPHQLLFALTDQFKYSLPDFKKCFGTDFVTVEASDICLYGEGYGPKIQRGEKYRDTPGFVLFDIRVGRWWLQRSDVESIAESLNIDVVPIVKTGMLGDGIAMVARGFDSKWGNFKAEGLVARPAIELKARNGSRIITKIKHCDF